MAFFKKKRERALFITHKDPLAAPEFAVGQTVPVAGRLWQITRWRELPPVHLTRGGSAREWEILGRVLDEDEVSAALEGAAEQILREADERDGV